MKDIARPVVPEPGSALAQMRRLWQLAGPERSGVLTGVLLRFLQYMALGLSFAVMVRVMTDLAGGRSVTAGWIWQAGGLMALSITGQLGFGYLAMRAASRSAYKVAGHLRLYGLEKLRHLPLQFHHARHRGDTVTVLTSDIQAMAGFFTDALPRMAQALGLPVMIFLAVFWHDRVIAMTMAVPAVAAMGALLLASRYLSRLSLERQDMQVAASGKMIEFVQGLAVIRSFNHLYQGQDGFRRAIDDFRDISVRMALHSAVPAALSGMFLMLGVPLVTWVAGGRMEAGLTDSGTAVATLLLLFAMYSPLLAVQTGMEAVRMALTSLSRIERLMSAEPMPEADTARPRGFTVKFDNVTFGYDAYNPVLHNIFFTVPECSMTAIVGPSGAGKSTVLNLIPRLWDADSGCVTIGGADVAQIGSRGLSELITVVFQDVLLLSGTIRDNIAVGKPDATDAEIERAARAAQAHDFIARLPDGYNTRSGEGGRTLSGGERQRISIARAILKNAPIVLMDEATAAVDPSNDRAIQEALAELVKGRSLIIVAHKLQTIRSADQIFVLNRGQIVESGLHDALLDKNGLYAQLWSHKVKAADWQL